MKKIINRALCLMLALVMAFSINLPSLAKNSTVSKNNTYTKIFTSAIINPIGIELQRQKARAYKKAKNACKKTANHSTQLWGSLGKTGDPYSSKDLYDKQGRLKQRRYYDKNGNADLDIDYRHGGNGKEPFPHKHKWNNGTRGKAYW